MRTIFIPIFHGIEALNILRTDIFGRLSKESDVRIILFVPSEERLNYYRKEFKESNNLVYEIFDGYKGGFLDKILDLFKVYLLKTDTMDLKRELKMQQTGNTLRYYISSIFNEIVARPFFRKIARFLDYNLVSDTDFCEVFDKYKPDIVFLAHLFEDVEVAMLREAKRRNIKSIGFINSWDKLTARCILRILPDRLIVPNEITKEEAIRYHDAKEETIFVSGPPQFDLYKKTKFSSKENFYRALGIDISKQILLYCPVGRAYSDADGEMIKFIEDSFKNGKLPDSVHVIVRLPPNDTIEIPDYFDKEHFSYVRPGTRFESKRGINWDMNFDDLQLLADSVYHSSLVVAFASTMSIDASILNKPVINISFSTVGSKSLFGSPKKFYDMTHYKNILVHKGIDIVDSEQEFINSINRYLKNPNLDSIGRRKIVDEQVWKTDGMAGERIGNFVLDLLKH